MFFNKMASTTESDQRQSSAISRNTTRNKQAETQVVDVEASDVVYVPETPGRPPNFDVNQAYTEDESDKFNVGSAVGGMFSKFSHNIRSLFFWRKAVIKNSVSPVSGATSINYLNSLPNTSHSNVANLKNKTNDIHMNTVSTKDSFSSHKYSHSSEVFNHNLSSDNTHSNANRKQQNPEEYLSYESKIYSVNSAGNPIPLTIENSRGISEDEESYSRDSDDCSELHSEAPLQNPITPNSSLKERLLKIWWKTYHPDSLYIYCWLTLVSLVFLYNVWLIPLRASFISDLQTPYQTAWFILDAFCDLIYIADIIIKFRTRVVKHGIYVTDVTALTHHHMKKWTLALDIISLLPTDFFFVITINPYLRLNRILKVHRAYEFYRMVELKTWWPNAFRLTNLLLILATIVHYNACIFYGSCVTNGFGTTLSSWAYPNPLLFPDYASLTRKYTFSFYWMLREVSLVGGRPLPNADWEYIYAIYLNFVGYAVVGYVIGYLAVILLGKNYEKFEFEHSMTSTRKYLKRRKLPKDLRRRVEEFYEHLWNKSEFGHLDEEKMLRHLPLSVKEEIAYHGNYAALKELPEFTYCDSNVLKNLVAKLKRRTYLPGQFIYKSGDPGTEMFIVGEGVLQIIRERDGKILTARDGDIFGEMNLFDLHRNHRRTSDVVSCGYCELYVLTAHDVNDVLSKYPQFRNVILQQAKRKKALHRRKMSENFYGRQLQYMASTGSTESAKFLNSPSHVQIKMGRNSSSVTGLGTFSGTSMKATDGFNVSPDSGMAPSPERQSKSEAELQTEQQAELNIPEEVSKKLNALMLKNAKTLNEVWLNEFMFLKKKLENTETERDHKAKEVMQLRFLVDNQKSQYPSTRHSSTTTIAESIPEEGDVETPQGENIQDSSKKSSFKRQSNIKVRPGTKSKNKRTFMPKSTTSNSNKATTKETVT